jgi:hypothetical protein
MLSSGFNRLDTIQSTEPELTPENWCEVQPCRTIKLGSREIILTQPSSTFFVYVLGILTVGVGVHFWQVREDEASRLWWSLSLFLWGVGALLAGTSYQALGYHIKCAGRETCTWTSWWEVIYLIFQQLSMDALLVAVAFSSTEGTLRSGLLGYALVSAVAYTLLTFIGGFIPVRTLITFEWMVWFSAPIFLIICMVNSWRYLSFGNPIDLALLGTWILLLLVMVAYWLYDKLGFTQKLWARGVWFSQNDLLHIGLILWMIYIATVVAHRVVDLPAA